MERPDLTTAQVYEQLTCTAWKTQVVMLFTMGFSIDELVDAVIVETPNAIAGQIEEFQKEKDFDYPAEITLPFECEYFEVDISEKQMFYHSEGTVIPVETFKFEFYSNGEIMDTSFILKTQVYGLDSRSVGNGCIKVAYKESSAKNAGNEAFFSLNGLIEDLFKYLWNRYGQYRKSVKAALIDAIFHNYFPEGKFKDLAK